MTEEGGRLPKAYYKRAKMMQSLQRLALHRKRSVKTRYIDTSIGAIRVLEYGFEEHTVTPLYFDLHGGGFVLMTADSDDAINRYLRKETGVKIVSIDYPKAPDYPFPAALDAVYEVALHYIRNAEQYFIDASRVGIGGHSAGANLSTVTCMRAKEKGDVRFRYQVLDYPPLDLYTSPFEKPLPKRAIPPQLARMFNRCYADPEQTRHPHVSPIYAGKEDLVGLPPAIMIVAGLDSLHDEGLLYAKMLSEAGVEVEVHDFEHAAHGFTLKPGSDTQRALELMASFVNRHMHTEEGQEGLAPGQPQ